MANIRWKKNEKTDLEKLVRSYNSKIKRLANKGYKDAPLPKKESFKKIRDSIVTRQDLEVQTELLKSFTARYATNVAEKGARGAIIPYYVKHQTEIKLDIVNEKRAIQRKIYEGKPVTDRNEPIDPKNRFEDENLSHLDERKVNYKNMSKKELALMIESLSNYDETIEAKNEHYRENFYKSLSSTLSPEHDKKVKEVMDKLSTDIIIDKYYTDINMRVSFHYEPSEYKALYESILTSWSKVLNEQRKEKLYSALNSNPYKTELKDIVDSISTNTTADDYSESIEIKIKNYYESKEEEPESVLNNWGEILKQ